MDPIAAGGVLTIDLGAIRANYRLLRDRLGAAACGAVVKADAYGLGAASVVPVLEAAGCRHFFVAQLEEAAALRPILPPEAALFVLNGVPRGAEHACAQLPAIPVLNSLEQLAAWQARCRAAGKPLPAALQVDTGMARLGLCAAELALLIAEPLRLDGVGLVLVMSHLACAEQAESALNGAQLGRFRAARAALPGVPASLANSAGVFLGPTIISTWRGPALPCTAWPRWPAPRLRCAPWSSCTAGSCSCAAFWPATRWATAQGGGPERRRGSPPSRSAMRTVCRAA